MNPDEIMINLLFNACAQVGTPEALELTKKVSKEMPKSCYSNDRITNSLLDALINCGDCSYAEICFSELPKRVESYGNLMSGFNRENNPSKTLDLFNQMKNNGIEPNMIIYLCVIKALSLISNYALCQSIVQHIPPHFLLIHQIQNALIDMWVSIAYFLLDCLFLKKRLGQNWMCR